MKQIFFFLEFPCFFYDQADVGNLISVSSAFSKPSLSIWKFLVHVLLKPSLKDFEDYLASMWNEQNCMVVWTFFGIALLWDWNETFPVPWPMLSFPNLLAHWVQQSNSIILQDLNWFSWNSITSTRFVCSNDDHVVLSFLLWGGLGMLNYPCHPGMHSACSWCIFFMCCWNQCANILLRTFASVFIKDFDL